MFSHVYVGDWIKCTKSFRGFRTAGKWYQRVLNRHDEIISNFIFKPNDDIGLVATDKFNDFDLSNVLTDKQYQAIMKGTLDMSNKRIKPVNIDDVWSFIEKYHPNYDKSQLVARSNEIAAIFDNNYGYMSLVECEELRHEADEVNLTLLMEALSHHATWY